MSDAAIIAARQQRFLAELAELREERYSRTVARHGAILWEAAAYADRSAKIRDVLFTFRLRAEISDAQARLLFCIVRDLRWADANQQRQEGI